MRIGLGGMDRKAINNGAGAYDATGADAFVAYVGADNIVCMASVC